MHSYRVCVYAICKNEEKFVRRWMDSMGEADLVVVTDTGSTDGTVEALRRQGAIVHEDVIQPWRFDVARNVSLSHVPEDVDICVCTDLDEIFTPGWRAQLEKAWGAKDPQKENGLQSQRIVAKRGQYLYNWSLKPDGTPDVQFFYSKIHDRHDFRWSWPVHEYLVYTGKLPLVGIQIDGIVLNHYPDASKPRSSYLPLLELGAKEMPMDPRMRYYLGREYMYAAQWQKCIDTLTDFLSLPTATWNEERCAGMRWIAKSCLMLGQVSLAYVWYYRAIAEAPHMRDPFVEFARMCNDLGDFSMALLMAGEALKIKQRSPTYVNMGYAWDDTPSNLHANALERLQASADQNSNP